ncbi:MAG: NAD-dependent deacylase [Aeromonadales bacterium]|nr:NAD-dependent deacylase [Aeromonadales bacterium]
MGMYKSIVILTGAGISAESGIPVFRSETGLWEQEKVEEVATYEGFMRDKTKVHAFYNKMRTSLKDKKPNPAHLALAKLEKEYPQKFGGSVSLITQNIDNLHEMAGSEAPIHMHGELMSILCEHCGARYSYQEDSSVVSECAMCHHKALRPDIVWFGEMPYHMDEIQDLLVKCDLFMAVGTSGVVYPAAGFCSLARQCGATCVEFNLEKSQVASDFNYGIYGKASVTLVKAVDELLEKGTLSHQA